MMSDPKTIDAITSSPDGRISLVMTEHRNWAKHQDEMHREFWNKLNAYVAYTLSDQFAREFPEKTGADVAIVVMTACAPPPETLSYFDKARRRLEKFKIGLEHKTFDFPLAED